MPDPQEQTIGIDLGTTFSAMAQLDRSGQPVTLPNAEGELTTASVVLFDLDGTVVVGREARRASLVYPDRVADCVKRDMGQPLYHRPVAGKRLAPQSIAAMILRKLRQDAEQRLRAPVTEAVITVPAFFDEARRQATVDAGAIAGLRVLDIINEPTSAALAYAFQRMLGEGVSPEEAAEALRRQDQPRRAMVYDLGGGTFDVTIMEMHGTGVRVLATDGAVRLGGKDWDERIVNYAAEAFLAEHDSDPREDPQSHQDLLLAAEEAKKDLSRREVTRFSVNHAGHHVAVELTRKQFEEETNDLLYRTESRVVRVIRQAKLTWQEIDEVLLVGGSTRMPQVRQMLRKVTQREPNASLSADEVVAHGAAIHAAIIKLDPERLVYEAREAPEEVAEIADQELEVVVLPAGSDEPIELGPPPVAGEAAGRETTPDQAEPDSPPVLVPVDPVDLQPQASEAPPTAFPMLASEPGGQDATGDQAEGDSPPVLAPAEPAGQQPPTHEPPATDAPAGAEDEIQAPVLLDPEPPSAAPTGAPAAEIPPQDADSEEVETLVLEEDGYEIEAGPPPMPAGGSDAAPTEETPVMLAPGESDDAPDLADLEPASAPPSPQPPNAPPLAAGEPAPSAPPPPPVTAEAPPAPIAAPPKQAPAGSAPPPPAPAPQFQDGVADFLGKFQTSNVNAHSLGVIVWSALAGRERVNVLIPRNTTLPASERRVYGTVSNNQRLVRVRVTEGESEDPDGCVLIGECVVAPLPPDLPMGSPISVTFAYDNSGRLHVRARDEASGLTAKCTIVRSGAMNPQTLERSREALSVIPIT